MNELLDVLEPRLRRGVLWSVWFSFVAEVKDDSVLSALEERLRGFLVRPKARFLTTREQLDDFVGNTQFEAAQCGLTDPSRDDTLVVLHSAFHGGAMSHECSQYTRRARWARALGGAAGRPCFFLTATEVVSGALANRRIGSSGARMEIERALGVLAYHRARLAGQEPEVVESETVDGVRRFDLRRVARGGAIRIISHAHPYATVMLPVP